MLDTAGSDPLLDVEDDVDVEDDEVEEDEVVDDEVVLELVDEDDVHH